MRRAPLVVGGFLAASVSGLFVMGTIAGPASAAPAPAPVHAAVAPAAAVQPDNGFRTCIWQAVHENHDGRWVVREILRCVQHDRRPPHTTPTWRPTTTTTAPPTTTTTTPPPTTTTTTPPSLP